MEKHFGQEGNANKKETLHSKEYIDANSKGPIEFSITFLRSHIIFYVFQPRSSIYCDTKEVTQNIFNTRTAGCNLGKSGNIYSAKKQYE
jgi:hypothetical protein